MEATMGSEIYTTTLEFFVKHAETNKYSDD